MMFDPDFERFLRRRERIRWLREGAQYLALAVVAGAITFGFLWLALATFGGTGR